ncbi:DsbC family protein [Ideonella azotifigens]|uniref:Thiol:disulfide interchange protein n=1 Tax=Ideonella azotifigens TaxID=513160 RepID=A0ABN1K0J5_9BURK|nr:DsbC family protein [Ideonella azotifigens]MCD2341549.1 DsbC family protein [Ideonella azotifigens]
MTSFSRAATAALLGALSLAFAGTTLADEAAIRKTLADRMPGLPKIDEVSKTSMPGLWEVRMGTDVVYSDDTGNYIIEGSLFETKTKSDLTKARIDKLTAIDFDQLPVKDALVVKQGTGARKIAVFADPNCGYCKRLEKDLLTLKDVTIYTYVIPILGGDSPAKSRDIWCAKDSMKTWRNWMIDGAQPPKSIGECDSTAISRNSELARKYKVNGTPAIVFEDGTRSPGAMPAAAIEKQLGAQKVSSSKG